MSSLAEIEIFISKLSTVDGITPLDIASLPPPLDSSMRKLMRKGSMTLEEFAAENELTEKDAQRICQMLVNKGYLRAEECEQSAGVVYRTYFARAKGRVTGTGSIPPLF